MKVYYGVRVPITVERWIERYGWAREEAEKMAKENASDAMETRVYVRESGSELYELPHYPYHSPDGFEWGYAGSGPAELARCILIDHFGVTPVKRGIYYETTEPELPVSYQDFKERFIEALPQDGGFEISALKIEEWAAAS